MYAQSEILFKNSEYMRIVYCIAKTCASGGMERVLSIKANYLIQQGYEVFIITTDQRGGTSFFPLDNRITSYDLGINYEENNGKRFLNKLLNYPLKQRKHKQRLTKLLVDLHADIVVSMFCNDVSFITDIRDGSKKVLEIHFSKFKRIQYARKGLWGLTDRILTIVDERLVRKFDRFVVLTNEDKGYWGDLSNIEVIANPLPFRVKRIAALKNKKVIAIGRFNYQKGFDLLIKAWAIVHAAYPAWNLDIIGEGELHSELQQQIDANGLQKCITLLQPTKAIEEIYRQSSLIVMSSRYEGLPMVLLEAQTMGLPIVSFACKCGPRDIISNGVDGYLVPDFDIEKLSNSIMELLADFDLRKRMGKAAKKSSKRFSLSKVMRKWMDLFEDITINKEKRE